VAFGTLAAAIFFCAMGFFSGAATLYVTQTPVNRLLGHQAAEIVLFCVFAIALFAVIATLGQTTLGQTMWTWISR